MSAASEGSLDGLDLHGDCREHGLLQSVELIEAAPCSTLDDADEDTTHALHINTLRMRRDLTSRYETLISTCMQVYVHTCIYILSACSVTDSMYSDLITVEDEDLPSKQSSKSLH